MARNQTGETILQKPNHLIGIYQRGMIIGINEGRKRETELEKSREERHSGRRGDQ